MMSNDGLSDVNHHIVEIEIIGRSEVLDHIALRHSEGHIVRAVGERYLLGNKRAAHHSQHHVVVVLIAVRCRVVLDTDIFHDSILGLLYTLRLRVSVEINSLAVACACRVALLATNVVEIDLHAGTDRSLNTNARQLCPFGRIIVVARHDIPDTCHVAIHRLAAACSPSLAIHLDRIALAYPHIQVVRQGAFHTEGIDGKLSIRSEQHPRLSFARHTVLQFVGQYRV